MKVLFTAILFSLLTSACTKEKSMSFTDQTLPIITTPASSGTRSYLALGDSYTIGESVAQQESFPFQLQSLLKAQNIDLPVLAVGGITIEDVEGLMDAGIFGIASSSAINQAADMAAAYLAFYNKVK